MIALTPVSLAVAVVALVLGLIEVVFLDRLVFPPIRRRHEIKKVTGRQGMDPDKVMDIIRLQSLIGLPVLGLVFGEYLFGDVVRNLVL